MTDLKDSKILILSTNGFQQEELFEPKAYFEEKNATVLLASPEAEKIQAGEGDDREIKPDMTIEGVVVGDYDALILPGGLANPDVLRQNKKAISLIREFAEAGKVIGAICHAPWLLVEAQLTHGREMTSFPSIRTDLENAGANWIDEQVVCDNAIVTSRNPDDIPAFNAKIAEEIREGKHERDALTQVA
ncbi:protease [Litorimonas cladophorae]|uniref:Protease n=1 Tax=Litorimonas cladophorae TaxID=1220491 RepID=A0A918NCX6_9PROT|nr:type 1 glutamine amidotransferase domain-containing protein [Litorimonas cladophorae]GGX61014.1 protease [Litorimonas cladophorae]